MRSRRSRSTRSAAKAWFDAVGEANVVNSKHMGEEERQGLTDFRMNADIAARHDLAVKFAAFEAEHITGRQAGQQGPRDLYRKDTAEAGSDGRCSRGAIRGPICPARRGPRWRARRWAWVKAGAWGGAIVVLLCAAAVTTWLVTRVQTAVTNGRDAATPGNQVVEPPPVVSEPAPAPEPVTAEADVATVEVEPVSTEPPAQEAPVSATLCGCSADRQDPKPFIAR